MRGPQGPQGIMGDKGHKGLAGPHGDKGQTGDIVSPIHFVLHCSVLDFSFLSSLPLYI